MPIQVRHINYVIAAADHGSFRRAAAALGVHESAISRRIRDLEIRLGAALFIRSAGGVQLTQAGKTFVQRGRQAMTQIGLARSEVGALGRGEAGEIKIGILSAVGAGFLSELISDFGAANATVRMTFVDGDQAEHVGALRLGELDIAFVTGNAEWPECETEQMWTERVYVALPEQHPLAAKEEVSWQDIGAERLIVSDVPPGPEIHDYLIQRLAELARHPLIEHHNVGRFNLLSLVALGRGLTLASEGVALTEIAGLQFRPMVDAALPYSAVWSQQNDNPAFLRLLGLARSMAQTVPSVEVSSSPAASPSRVAPSQTRDRSR